MSNQVTDGIVDGAANDTAALSVKKAIFKRKPRAAAKSAPAGSGKPATKSKRDQLVALLSKSNGARLSVIVERLGWQAHTVRAALSGLRKQGIEITRSTSPKTGEAVYAIVAQEDGNSKQAGEDAAS